MDLWRMRIYSRCGLIEGIAFVPIDGMELPYPTLLESCIITPKGIEYLCDNSFMEKAKKFLKNMKKY